MTQVTISQVDERISVLQSLCAQIAEEIKIKTFNLDGLELELTALKYYRDSLKLEESD